MVRDDKSGDSSDQSTCKCVCGLHINVNDCAFLVCGFTDVGTYTHTVACKIKLIFYSRTTERFILMNIVIMRKHYRLSHPVRYLRAMANGPQDEHTPAKNHSCFLIHTRQISHTRKHAITSAGSLETFHPPLGKCLFP